MEFDITKIDKVLLIQTLFSHSAPLGLGKAEYDTRRKGGQNVEGLTDDECYILLYDFNNNDEEFCSIADYYKGKPIKLNFQRKKNGRILVDSDRYDSRNGKFRFFEAMLNIFSLDEIYITKKGYGHYALEDLTDDQKRPPEEEIIFKGLLKNTVKATNDYGKYWLIDEKKVSYKSAFSYEL